MKPVLRKHLIICLVLWLLAIPIYFLDHALFGSKAGGGSWITLDFRGLIFWTYVTLLAIQVIVSSIAVLLFRKTGLLLIQFGSVVISVILLVTGVTAYGKLRRLAISNEGVVTDIGGYGLAALASTRTFEDGAAGVHRRRSLELLA